MTKTIAKVRTEYKRALTVYIVLIGLFSVLTFAKAVNFGHYNDFTARTLGATSQSFSPGDNFIPAGLYLTMTGTTTAFTNYVNYLEIRLRTASSTTPGAYIEQTFCCFDFNESGGQKQLLSFDLTETKALGNKWFFHRGFETGRHWAFLIAVNTTVYGGLGTFKIYGDTNDNYGLGSCTTTNLLIGGATNCTPLEDLFFFFTDPVASTSPYLSIEQLTQVASSTFSVFNACDYYGNGGIFDFAQVGVCKVTAFLLIPNDTALNKFNELQDKIERKYPFQYLTDAQLLLTQFSSSTATSSTFSFNNLGGTGKNLLLFDLASASSLGGSTYTNLRLWLGYIIYFVFGLWVFMRIKKIL